MLLANAPAAAKGDLSTPCAGAGGEMKRGSAGFIWRKHPGRRAGAAAVLLAVVLLLLLTPLALAGQKGKKKEPSRDQSKSGSATEALPRLPDGEAIDLAISEMLGAWQIGDIEMLHKYYADDVTVVSGAWEPPLIGWVNFVQAYQTQRVRVQGAQLERRNTLVKVTGNLAWADYQWEFSATVDGKPTSARGHTTLILERRNDRWLIVHNHTSLVSDAAPPQPASPPGRGV